MSVGLHRLWKRFAVDARPCARAGQRVLDLAGGTGDLARLFAARVGPDGRRRAHRHQRRDARRGPRQAARRGLALPTVQCNAEALPFPRPQLRLRVDRLRPAQRDAQGAWRSPRCAACCARAASRSCSNSRASRAPLAPAYDWYSFNVLPRLGQLDRQRRGELPLPRRIDPRAPGPGGAEADDGTSGLRPGRIPQPDGRRRRAARRTRLLIIAALAAILRTRDASAHGDRRYGLMHRQPIRCSRHRNPGDRR